MTRLLADGLVDLQLDPKLAWYLTRSSGLVLLVLFTLATVLGIASRVGQAGRWVPRFVATDLHRRISLLAVLLLVLHVLSSIADNWATITYLDAVVPFQGSYRPLWLGFGTLTLDVILAMVGTSLLRHRMPPRAWKAIHLSVYAVWPVAVLHGLGTGSDTRKIPVLILTFACVGLVLLTVGWRILGAPDRLRLPQVATLVALPLAPPSPPVMRADTPFKTIHEVTKAAVPPKCGSTGTGSPSYFLVKFLNQAIGTKFEVVTGYQGGQEIDLAVERNEVVCRGFTVTTFFAREPFTTWRKKNLVRVLLQTGHKRDAKMPDVPTIHELMAEHKASAPTRAFVTAILASGDLGRPFVTPPAIPADRLKILREAFRKTMADPGFLADVKARKFEIDPEYGEELEKLAKEIVSQPKEITDRMKKLLSE